MPSPSAGRAPLESAYPQEACAPGSDDAALLAQELASFTVQRRSLFYPKTDLPLSPEILRALGSEAARSEVLAFIPDLCKRVFRQHPASVAPLSDAGTFHWLYRACFDDGASAIVRVHALSGLQRDFVLCIDRWAMDLLLSKGLPGLHVHHIDLSRRLCPFDYEILEEARGTSLKAFDGAESRMSCYLALLGRTVARLHEIRTRGYGFFDLQPLVVGGGGNGPLHGLCTSWREYILKNLEGHVQQCLDIAAVNGAEAARVFEAFSASGHVLEDVEPSLLHGDLGSHNVFIAGDQISALIDWEDCLSGDPVFDVAFWATFHPERRHAAFIDSYRSERPLPADFEWRFWLYFLRIALAKTVLRHRFHLQDQPGRQPASARIQLGLSKIESLLGGQAPMIWSSAA
jgi:hypothetical protein